MTLRLRHALLAALASTLTTALAHPGHDHGHMDTFEFAWHHWLTGGSFLAAIGFVACILRRRAKSKRAED